MTSKLKVTDFFPGERVLINGDQDGVIFENEYGTVLVINGGLVGVKPEDRVSGNRPQVFHNLRVYHPGIDSIPHCEDGEGFWFNSLRLQKAEYEYVPSQEGDRDDDI